MLWIQTKNFVSCFGSRSGLKLVSDPDQIQIKSDPNLDSNPELNPRNQDPNPGFGYRSTTGQKFLPSLIFKHKNAASPQLCDLATIKVRKNLPDSDPDPFGKRHGSADLDLYENVTDPQHSVQLLVNVINE